jgi:RNA polymerase sigma factor (sigma-70 family)
VSLPPFQHLLDAHSRDVHRLLVASVGAIDADDCYQETWLAAMRAYPKLRSAGNLRSWILTIASRKAVDHVRRGRRQAILVGEVPERAGPSPAPAGALATTHPDEGLWARQPDENLWALVRALPPKQRTALALRFVLDAGYGEISAVMGTTEEAARRSVHEGLRRLRTEYQP